MLPLLLRGSWTRHTSGFRDTKWDLALCLTDLPLRRDDGEVIVAELDCSRRVALISVPAVGGMNLRRRLHSLLVPLVAHLRGRQQAGDIAEHGRYRVHNGEQDGEVEVGLPSRTGMLRLLSGMVRANRPWRLVVGPVHRAGRCAHRYGVRGLLYSCIWLPATAMGPVRLAGTALAALVVLGGWIIVNHSLWERRPGNPRVAARDVRLRNAGTVATVGVERSSSSPPCSPWRSPRPGSSSRRIFWRPTSAGRAPVRLPGDRPDGEHTRHGRGRGRLRAGRRHDRPVGDLRLPGTGAAPAGSTAAGAAGDVRRLPGARIRSAG